MTKSDIILFSDRHECMSICTDIAWFLTFFKTKQAVPLTI